MRRSGRVDMLNGPLLQDLVICSIPLLAQQILQLLFSTTDVMVVSKFGGDNAVAAIGATSSLSNLLINLFYGVSIGTNVLVARYIGAQDHKAVDEIAHTSMAFSFFGGICLVIMGLFLSKPLLIMMGTPDDVLMDATHYMQVYFLAMPAMMVYYFGTAIMRSFGDTRRPVYFLTVAGVANIVFDILFVLILKSDAIAIALGTVFSQCVAAVLVWFSLTKDMGHFKIEKDKIKIHKNRLMELLKFGIPTGVQSSLFALSNMAIQSSVNSFGSLVIAGNTDAGNIESFVACPSNAVYSACMSFIAINIGAKNYSRVKKTVAYSLILAMATSGTIGYLAYVLGEPLMKIYTSNPEVISAGIVRLSKYSAFYVICSVMDVMSGTLRGMGYSFFPMCISLTGACAFRILWIETAVKAHPTLDTLYWCFPISWALVSLAFLICYKILLTRLIKKG